MYFITTSTYLLAHCNLVQAALKLNMKHPLLLKKNNEEAVIYIIYKYYYDTLSIQA